MVKYIYKCYYQHNNNMAKKGFTVVIDEDLWKKLSIKCVKEGKTKREVLTKLIKDFVED